MSVVLLDNHLMSGHVNLQHVKMLFPSVAYRLKYDLLPIDCRCFIVLERLVCFSSVLLCYICRKLDSAWIHMFANSQFNLTKFPCWWYLVFILDILERGHGSCLSCCTVGYWGNLLGLLTQKDTWIPEVLLQTIWIKSALNASSCNHITTEDYTFVMQDRFGVNFLHSFLVKPSFLLKLLLCHPKTKSSLCLSIENVS